MQHHCRQCGAPLPTHPPLRAQASVRQSVTLIRVYPSAVGSCLRRLCCACYSLHTAWSTHRSVIVVMFADHYRLLNPIAVDIWAPSCCIAAQALFQPWSQTSASGTASRRPTIRTRRCQTRCKSGPNYQCGD